MKQHRIRPGSTVKLAEIAPDDTGNYCSEDEGKAAAEEDMQALLEQLRRLQERLYAGSVQALLIVLQAMDTGGKDGTIKHVMSGVNPQGCRVTSFKVPTSTELAHDFLWRVHHEVPPRGLIGIFNHSHYEDVLVTRVHGQITEKLAEERFVPVDNYDELLAQSDVNGLKIFVNMSKNVQPTWTEERL